MPPLCMFSCYTLQTDESWFTKLLLVINGKLKKFVNRKIPLTTSFNRIMFVCFHISVFFFLVVFSSSRVFNLKLLLFVFPFLLSVRHP